MTYKTWFLSSTCMEHEFETIFLDGFLSMSTVESLTDNIHKSTFNESVITKFLYTRILPIYKKMAEGDPFIHFGPYSIPELVGTIPKKTLKRIVEDPSSIEVLKNTANRYKDTYEVYDGDGDITPLTISLTIYDLSNTFMSLIDTTEVE